MARREGCFHVQRSLGDLVNLLLSSGLDLSILDTDAQQYEHTLVLLHWLLKNGSTQVVGN